MDADVFCIQETKLQEGILELELEGDTSNTGIMPKGKGIQVQKFLQKNEPKCGIWNRY